MATNKDYKQQNKEATLGKGKDEQHGSEKSGQKQPMGGDKKEELGKKGSDLGQKENQKKGQQGGLSQQQKSGQQQGGFDKQGKGKIGDMDKDKKGGRKM